MNEEEKKLENGKEILQQIKNLKSDYQSELVDKVEEEMELQDRINQLIQTILGDNSISVYETLDKDSLERWKKNKFSRWIKRAITKNFRNTLYFMLLATITGFLVSEAVQFYAIEGMVDTKTWVKAILTEVSFIFLSGYRSSGTAQKMWVNILRGGIFGLMMFVISSQAIDTGTRTISENEGISKQVVLIEEQIKLKEKDIEYYKSIKWPRNVTRSTIEKNELVDKLFKLKEEQTKGKNKDVSEIERYKMYGRAIFRILLLFISVLITRRLFTF